jgi:hypothetical protein
MYAKLFALPDSECTPLLTAKSEAMPSPSRKVRSRAYSKIS